eukprot:COSAG01_NODE_8442_length_2783_cov_23.918033_4_plen_201_part_00
MAACAVPPQQQATNLGPALVSRRPGIIIDLRRLLLLRGARRPEYWTATCGAVHPLAPSPAAPSLGCHTAVLVPGYKKQDVRANKNTPRIGVRVARRRGVMYAMAAAVTADQSCQPGGNNNKRSLFESHSTARLSDLLICDQEAFRRDFMYRNMYFAQIASAACNSSSIASHESTRVNSSQLESHGSHGSHEAHYCNFDSE